MVFWALTEPHSPTAQVHPVHSHSFLTYVPIMPLTASKLSLQSTRVPNTPSTPQLHFHCSSCLKREFLWSTDCSTHSQLVVSSYSDSAFCHSACLTLLESPSYEDISSYNISSVHLRDSRNHFSSRPQTSIGQKQEAGPIKEANFHDYVQES